MSPNKTDLTMAAESLIVALARSGDRDAFAELVRRRQSWIRNLMRRLSGDPVLADDLAQQVFLQAWRSINHLRDLGNFGGWLKRLATNTWLQYVRKRDILNNAEDVENIAPAQNDTTSLSMDLDHALATLSAPVRLCIVLSYHEGMSHREISDVSKLPLGTIKSHIRRGTQHLQQVLSAYDTTPQPEKTA